MGFRGRGAEVHAELVLVQDAKRRTQSIAAYKKEKEKRTAR
jgi:hypothetical protein